jgi:hypothetical protein
MGRVPLLSILIKKDLEDIQKVQIKEMIERNIVDREEDSLIKELVNIVEKTEIDLSEKQILEYLKIEKRWPINYNWYNQPSVEIISNLGHSRNYFFNVDGYLDFEKWYEMYKLGFTTIISNVLDLNDSLRDLKNCIKTKLGTIVNGNFYFSLPGKKASFNLHKHQYHVIVKQIYGDSDWMIGKNKFTLKSKQVTHIPINTDHAVMSKNNKKLSLTLNIV